MPQILNSSSREREISHPNLSPHLHWVGSRAPWIRDSEPSCYFWPLLLPEDLFGSLWKPHSLREKQICFSKSHFRFCEPISDLNQLFQNAAQQWELLACQWLFISLGGSSTYCSSISDTTSWWFVLFVQEIQNSLIWIHTEITGSPTLIP